MTSASIFLLLSVLVFCATAERVRFDGYQVLQVVPTRQYQLKFLRELMTRDTKLDFWLDPRALHVPVQIMVPPTELTRVLTQFTMMRLPVNVIRENVQTQMDQDLARLEARFAQRGKNPFDINDYNRYEDIMSQLETWKGQCKTGVSCETYSIGNSIEGKEMKVFKMSRAGTGRPAIFMDSVIHAREWLAVATLLKIMNHTINGYGSDTDVTNLVDKYDFYYMPVHNPDGYIYSWDSNRMWRKNRRPAENDDECAGTDLNRNFAFKWEYADGTSDDSCSDVYRGASANSEQEVKNTQDEAMRLRSSMKAWITMHTAVQMWLMPYGTEDPDTAVCERSPDHDKQLAVANAAADATQETFGTTWTRGNTCETIYAASGSTHDYVYGTAGVRYAYTPELRGPGFDPPTSAIQPSFEEMWNGIKALIAEMERQG